MKKALTLLVLSVLFALIFPAISMASNVSDLLIDAPREITTILDSQHQPIEGAFVVDGFYTEKYFWVIMHGSAGAGSYPGSIVKTDKSGHPMPKDTMSRINELKVRLSTMGRAKRIYRLFYTPQLHCTEPFDLNGGTIFMKDFSNDPIAWLGSLNRVHGLIKDEIVAMAHHSCPVKNAKSPKFGRMDATKQPIFRGGFRPCILTP